MAAKLDDAGRELLIDQGRRLARGERRPRDAAPSRPRTSCATLMNMATGEEMSDLEFEARRELPAFKDVPVDDRLDRRQAGAPRGLQGRDHRQRLQRPRDGRAARAARHPVHGARAPPRARRHLEHQPLPRRPRRHDLDHLRVQLREELPVDRVLRPRRRGARQYLDHVSKQVRRLREHPASSTTSRRPRSTRTATCGCSRSTRPTASRRCEANAIVNAVGVFANPKFADVRGPGELRRRDPAPDPVARRLRRHRQARRRHRQRLDRRAAARARSRPTPSRCTSSSARRSGSAPATSTASPIEPEVRWLLDNFPGYWNWWRYMAIAALFGTHELPRRRPGVEGAGRHVQPDERQAARRPHRVHQGADRRPPRPHRQAGPRLRAVLAPPRRRQRLVPGAHPRQRRARHRQHRPAHADGHRDRRRHGPRRRRHRHRHRLRGRCKYLWPADYIGKDGVEPPRPLVEGRRRAPTSA